MTRPCRRMTLHLSQIGLTLGLTFMSIFRSESAARVTRLARGEWVGVREHSGPQPRALLVAVDDATAGEVVGAELHHHAVLGEDPDVVLAHLAGDVGENLVTVAQLDPEHRIG